MFCSRLYLAACVLWWTQTYNKRYHQIHSFELFYWHHIKLTPPVLPPSESTLRAHVIICNEITVKSFTFYICQKQHNQLVILICCNTVVSHEMFIKVYTYMKYGSNFAVKGYSYCSSPSMVIVRTFTPFQLILQDPSNEH